MTPQSAIALRASKEMNSPREGAELAVLMMHVEITLLSQEGATPEELKPWQDEKVKWERKLATYSKSK